MQKIKTNLSIREKAKECSVCLWEIAQELGISEPTMTRKMRKELDEKEAQHLLEVIIRIEKRKKEANK